MRGLRRVVSECKSRQLIAGLRRFLLMRHGIVPMPKLQKKEYIMTKIIASLIAGLFATAAFAQAPVAATTAPAAKPAVVKTEAKAEVKPADVKTEAKAEVKTAKTKTHHKAKAAKESKDAAPVAAAKADTKVAAK